jgi:hypothetical protein
MKHTRLFNDFVELIDTEAKTYIDGEINGRPLNSTPLELRTQGNLIAAGICRAALFTLHNTDEYLEFSEYVRSKGFTP